MRHAPTTGSRAMAALLTVLIASSGLGVRPAEARPAEGPAGPGDPAGPAEGAPAAAASPAAEGEEGGGAPTGLYRGKVMERKTGKPVAGAIVIFINEESGDTYEAAADANGDYEARLPAGEYVVDIRVGKKTYRSTGTFREEASGKRWVMDFTIGTKLTEKDLKIETTPRDIRVLPTEPRPPLEPTRKMMELFIFLGGLVGVAALSD